MSLVFEPIFQKPIVFISAKFFHQPFAPTFSVKFSTDSSLFPQSRREESAPGELYLVAESPVDPPGVVSRACACWFTRREGENRRRWGCIFLEELSHEANAGRKKGWERVPRSSAVLWVVQLHHAP